MPDFINTPFKYVICFISYVIAFMGVPHSYAICIPTTTTIDTIAPGVVRIEFCTPEPIPCYVDTVTESQLMKALVDSYHKNNTVVIAKIDTGFNVPIPPDTSGFFGAESVYISIDTILKGTMDATQYGFLHLKHEDEGEYVLEKNRPFTAFFDSAAIPVNFGLSPPVACSSVDFFRVMPRGYFIVNGRIRGAGISAYRGLSVSYDEFLNAISLSTMQAGKWPYLLHQRKSGLYIHILNFTNKKNTPGYNLMGRYIQTRKLPSGVYIDAMETKP